MAMKTCRKCGVEKPLQLFTKNKRRKDGTTWECVACASARKQAWSVATNVKERRKEYFAKWNKSERAREVKAEWRSENRDKHNKGTSEWRKRNPEKQYEYVKNFYAKYPWRVHEWHANRKAQKLRATPNWADKPKIQEWYKRAHEMTLATGISYTVDHIIPLRGKDVCGLHVEGNLQILTRSENSAKGHREYPQWQ